MAGVRRVAAGWVAQSMALGQVMTIPVTCRRRATRVVVPHLEAGVQLTVSRQSTGTVGCECHADCVDSDTARCVLQLREYGTRLVARSEAKRLVVDLDRFREVILDFSGVTGAGQGFVDQIFRVWAPGTTGLRQTGE